MTSLESTRQTLRGAGERGLGLLRRPSGRVLFAAGLAILLVALAVLSLFVGSGDISPAEVIRVLTDGGTDTNALLVRDYRVPRTLLAVSVGISLGVAGALIQGITRNPLADPGILGVNSGAYLAIVLSIVFAGVANVTNYIWFAFLGALVVSAAVYLIGSRGRGGATPVRLVLAGVALSYLLNGISIAITLRNPDVFDKIRFWQAGSLQSRGFDVFWATLPFLIAGLLVAAVVASALNSVALGDDLARSLGTNPVLVRAGGFVAITILCGAATAAAGPIAFLGLMAPYVARVIVGPEQRWLMGLTALVAPIIFISADMVGRVLAQSEVPVGLVTAFIGAPVLIFLIRRSQAKSL